MSKKANTHVNLQTRQAEGITPHGKIQTKQQNLSVYSGPLPPPEALEQYEKVSPGFAKEILEMARRSQAHEERMDIEVLSLRRETLALRGDFTKTQQRLFGQGQIIAAIIGVTAIIAGTVFCTQGAPAYGASMIGSVIALLAGGFLWGKFRGKEEYDKSEVKSPDSSIEKS